MNKIENNLIIIILNDNRSITYDGEAFYNGKTLRLSPRSPNLERIIEQTVVFKVEQINYLEINGHVIINKELENRHCYTLIRRNVIKR